MIARRYRPSLPAVLLLLVSALGAAPAQAQLRCVGITQLAREYLKHHVTERALSAEVESRAIDTYLRRLDPSRSLLIESEVEQMRSELTGVFERVQTGQCSQLDSLHQDLIDRHVQAEAFVSEVVASDSFELDESVELLIDPEKRGYPATEPARNELWRRLIHFQLSNYMGAGEELDEAKRLLSHRYALRTQRVRKLEQVEIYSVFLDSFASSLDPHSNYLSPRAVEDFQISMSLSLEGIGVALSERDGYSVVESIIPGGAADRLEEGLLPKDKIIAVAEEKGESMNIIDMPLREAVSLIRGKKGTTVHLTVLRQGERTERFPVSIVRDKIDLAESAASLRFEERQVEGKKFKLAIVELPSFYGNSDPSQRQCTNDLERLLNEVEEKGADGLLLDLSRNGGGLLEHAVKISGFFIRKGEVVGVENARGQLSVLSDRDERILYTGPMVVHVSRVSASASEILAGALKDYRRAVIAGDDHTFGKGTVQSVMQLPPGQGAIKVTTSRFFRPGGRSTQRNGVSSDIVIPSLLATDDFGESHQRYALPGEERASFLSSYANAIGPGDRFSSVSTDLIAELAQRSATRVGEEPAFAEIEVKLAEARTNDGVVRLAEILKQREEADGNGDGPDEPESTTADADTDADADATDADAAPESDSSPQIEEALHILGDLVALSRQGA